MRLGWSVLTVAIAVASCAGRVTDPAGDAGDPAGDAAPERSDARTDGAPVDALPAAIDAAPIDAAPPDAAGNCKTTCLGVECGPIPNGCGGTVDCGDCGGPTGQYCAKITPAFENAVRNAVSQVQSEHPEYFDFNDTAGGSSYRVLDTPAFRTAVVAIVNRPGRTAIPDPNDGREIRVRDDAAAFAENYLLVTSGGYSVARYTSTCFPDGY